MRSMFGYTTRYFNQDIGNWDTSSVTSFRYMFMTGQVVQNLGVFDQDLSGWDFSAIATTSGLERFYSGGDLSTSNYDALLVRWANQASSIPPNQVNVQMGWSTYTANSAAATARSTLINTYGWTIQDGGSV